MGVDGRRINALRIAAAIEADNNRAAPIALQYPVDVPESAMITRTVDKVALEDELQKKFGSKLQPRRERRPVNKYTVNLQKRA